MTSPRILSVGQCGFDHGGLSRYFADQFGARVDDAHTIDEAMNTLQADEFHLVLVNRIFDRDGTEGIRLIEKLKADSSLSSLPVMMVSNYPDAQRQAVELGALPGFGKAALRDAGTKERIGEALAKAAAASTSESTAQQID